jgi:hypothetical protein
VDKKYLIGIFITLVAGTVFFIYNSQKNEKELKSHENQQYDRMIEVANKSPMAGMGHMGRALNKYKEEKGAYPDKLAALYPEYIPVETFIDDIQWDYEPVKNDFYLTKTYENKSNQVLTATIRSDLRLRHGSMVASTHKQEHTSVPTTTKPVIKKPETRITLVSETNAKPILETDATGLYSSRHQTTGFLQKSLPPQKNSPYEPKLVSTTQLSEEEQFVERVKGNLLVWKKEDGTIGFGNVQYPNSEKMIIYDKGEWIRIRHRHPNSDTKMTPPKARAEREASVERLAAAYSDRFLVWKDPEGTVCLGNVQYPNNQNIQIHVEGSWQSAKK